MLWGSKAKGGHTGRTKTFRRPACASAAHPVPLRSRARGMFGGRPLSAPRAGIQLCCIIDMILCYITLCYAMYYYIFLYMCLDSSTPPIPPRPASFPLYKVLRIYISNVEIHMIRCFVCVWVFLIVSCFLNTNHYVCIYIYIYIHTHM